MDMAKVSDDQFWAYYSGSTTGQLKDFGGRMCGSIFAIVERFYPESKSEFDQSATTRRDWIRECVMACVELCLAITPENIRRLLADRVFFESCLPYDIHDDRWGANTGTELVRQWWLLHSDDYRKKQLYDLNKIINCISTEDIVKISSCSYSSSKPPDRWF